MEREANYAAVGAFVLLVVIMGTLFVYWYSDAREHRDFSRYEIYFTGSVSGLSRGSAVRFLGVDVGRVVTMRIDPRNSTRVQVIADIDSSAPVSQRTVAELSLQGVTGLLYIDLIQSAGNRPLSEAVPSEQYPVIRSARSNFDLFLSGLPELVANANALVDRAMLVFSEENLKAVNGTLGNVEQASARLPATMREIEALTGDLRQTSTEIRAAAAGVRTVTDASGPQLNATVERVYAVADNLAKATERLDLIIADNRDSLRSFTHNGLPEFEALMRESRAAAQEFRELSRSLRDNPSRVLYQPVPGGTEIPR